MDSMHLPFPKLLRWNHGLMLFGGGAFGRSFRSWGLSIAPLRRDRQSVLLFLPEQEGGRLQTGGEPSPGSQSAGTLTLDFPASRLWEINVYCLSQAVYGIFGIAVQTKTEHMQCIIKQ